VDGEEDFGAAGEVLYVAVSAVFGAAGDSSCAFFADFVFQVACSGAGVDVLGLGWLGDGAVEVRVCSYEFAFALVPQFEDVLRRGAAEDAGVDEACEADAGDVARRTEDAFKVPDGFCAGVGVSSVSCPPSSHPPVSYSRLGIELVQEAAPVFLCENACETPRLLVEWLHILNLHDKNIACFCCLNIEWPGEVVDLCEVDVAYVVCGVVVAYLTTSPEGRCTKSVDVSQAI
jgi:hypothetical protein